MESERVLHGMLEYALIASEAPSLKENLITLLLVT